MELMPYLLAQVKLTVEEYELIDKAFAKKNYLKGKILEQPNNHSKQLHFIEKGLLRAFYCKDDKDITHTFFDEDNFILAFESVFFGRPHPYGLEILEETTIRTIPYSQLDVLCNTIPAFKDYRLIVSLKIISMLAQKVYSLQFQSAKERYNTLLETTPRILLRASLGHIASYLGITQQTLSVIRAGK